MVRGPLAILVLVVPPLAQAAPPTVAVPARWIQEAPDLGRTLPRRARAMSEQWISDASGGHRHCYQLTVDRRSGRRIVAALARLGGEDEEGVMVVRAPGSIATALGDTARFCFDYAPAAWAAQQPAMSAALAALASIQPLFDLLGGAARVERGQVAGSAPDIKVVFARAGVDVAQVEAWARARGLAGDRQAGWFGAVEDALRVVISFETHDGREVVVVEAALPR